jgi:serine phosphatase RsbU (regulator of sigma subunit)
MTPRRLLILFAFALIGYGGLFFLFPRLNPAARWNFKLNRAAAIDKTKATAPSSGFSAASQYETVVTEYSRAVEYYLAKQTDPLLGPLLSPVSARVRLNDAPAGVGFEAKLNAHGELISFRRRERSSRQGRPSKSDELGAPPPAVNKDDLSNDRRIAEEALQRLSGEQFGKFSFLAGSNTGKEDRKFTWAASDDRIKVLADVTVRNGQVRELWLQPSLTPKFQAEFDSRRSGAAAALSAANGVLIWPAIILVIILYFVGLARRQINHRKTLIFLALCFLLLLATNLLGNFADDFRDDFRVSNPSLSYRVEAAILWTVFALVNLSIAFTLYLFWAAGLSIASSLPNRRTIDLELLLQGKLLRRPVTGSITAGLLIGGLLALIPYAVAAVRVFSGATINASGIEDVFAARLPAFNTFVGGGQYLVFMTFAFLIPCVEAFVKRLWMSWMLIFIIVFLSLVSLDAFHTSAPAIVGAGLLQTWLLVRAYRNFGLLAVIVSTMAGQLAVNAAGLLAQPSATLQSSGWRAIIGLGAAAAVALIGLWRSSEAKEDEIAVVSFSENRADRDRLQAEFNVARRAQQHMIPDQAPDLPGFSISAVCLPSREVGGDLYDFLALPGGRVGIVVADVSGKGVPASLYMTLTKGLLDSITEYQTDPGEILRAVNRHLYEVCRRRMFVTLFLGIIDPCSQEGTRMLTYARAGHNPTIIYRAAEQKTGFLKSPGMGLGLNSGRIFDQSLKVETLQLGSRDKLFFYSDGITEAMNEKNEEYGEARLMEMAARTDGLNAEESRNAVLADVAKFLGSVQPQDDQTLVVVQVV